jgi:hypothetical protein
LAPVGSVVIQGSQVLAAEREHQERGQVDSRVIQGQGSQASQVSQGQEAGNLVFQASQAVRVVQASQGLVGFLGAQVGQVPAALVAIQGPERRDSVGSREQE